ncbi:MAG: hypothetical protein A2X08_06275 [Bacteroidetes bacterium GWA2_32_17]|nr:MAG: hypothetical protein A2X08_06275 [Bacteroidetes bacterium GWA2_32_17]
MNISFIKAIIWAILIFIGSYISGNSLNEIKFINIPGFDKIIHFTWYFVLTLFVLAGTDKWLGKIKFISFLIIVLMCVSYGALMEYLQGTLFVARSMDIFDFIANSTGTIVGAILFSGLYKRKFWRKIL